MPIDRKFLVQHFGDLWPVHNREFAALLIECRKHFDGDLDEMLVLSVIGDRTLAPDRTAGLDYGRFLTGERGPETSKRINTQSVADSTGIPRETVRRKIQRLIERGWVGKSESGSLTVTRAAAVDLAPATDAALAYLIALGNALETRVKNAAEAKGKASSAKRG